MASFLFRRFLVAIFQIFIVVSLIFMFIHLMPGDPVILALGTEKSTDPQVVEALRHELGLDKPILEQYGDYLKNITKLDFGKSITDKVSVSDYIMERIPRTIEIAVLSIILGSIMGVIFGIISATKWQTIIDIIMTSIATLGISVPVFVLGTIFILIFSLNLKWLPAGGFVDISKGIIAHYTRLILPVVTLALGLAASVARMTRSSMLEVLHKEFVPALRAKGLARNVIIFKHVLRNAFIPIITVIGLQLGNLIGGTVLIEYLFNLPGLCSILIKAVSYRDYPVIQGCIFVMSSFYIIINLIVDILYGILDPRVR
ncbi:ABC transporter permease [Tepidanaerobacter syntrophicus]|uniref:ABC transporter permease n=1 Tax=Tepidanaerobacter syntrophicus TaxID=224999 RepID=UPI001BD67254|nr:ABC transporter permease [Tepidanaerobacter syntrophicus]